MGASARFTAGQVAAAVGGELIGRRDLVLAGVAPLARAGPGELSLLTSPRYRRQFAESRAGAVLVSPAFRDEQPGPATRIVVPDPLAALARIAEALEPPPAPPWGVHPTATLGRGVRWRGRVAIGRGALLGPDVVLGPDCVIGAHAVIERGAVLGERCHVEPQATVHAGATLGNRVVVRAGARVGGAGFGFRRRDDRHEAVPQLGRCTIGNDVEIGANTTIDRGSLDDTTVGSGTKIDNLVQVAHNVHVGARCIIMAQVGIAGSTIVEDDVMLAGQAGLADHLTVGQGARIAAQSGVIGDIAPGDTVSGYPARSHRAVLRQTAALARLTPLVPAVERMLARHEHGSTHHR